MFPAQVTTYLVKEIFGPTVQGEGAHSGRPCVFLRFAVCNLACSWCDTDFAQEGAAKLASEEIVRRLQAVDLAHTGLVVVTGGEPALQWDHGLAEALSSAGFRVHMESNGTRELAAPVDWLTVSPKPQFHEGGRFRLARATSRSADECKVVVDDTVDEYRLDQLARDYPCEHRFLQPCDGDDRDRHLQRTLKLIQQRPQWRLSLQLHKLVGLP